VFGALAGINGQDDFEVVLGALLGAAVFVTTVVLGTVLLVSQPRCDRALGAIKK
jgi:Ca2+/Na+ antiporter